MTKPFTIFISIAVLALAARAQPTGAAVSESTDPGRVGAVERKAREIQLRQARAAATRQRPSPDGLVRGKSPAGVPWVCGGIGSDQLARLRSLSPRYSLWAATVAKGSGAYISDARLRIVSLPDRQPLLSIDMYGPWCFASLLTGRYEVSATWGGEDPKHPQTETTTVEVVAGEQRQAILRFDSSAQVDPMQDEPFRGQPFGAPTPSR